MCSVIIVYPGRGRFFYEKAGVRYIWDPILAEWVERAPGSFRWANPVSGKQDIQRVNKGTG